MYWDFVFTILKRTNSKIISSLVLYLEKFYNESYYFSLIAQEELSKIIIITFAKEYDDLTQYFGDRKNIVFNHKIKQKYFSSYATKNRRYDVTEKRKQSSLYVALDSDGNILQEKISRREAYNELFNAYIFIGEIYSNICTASDNVKEDIIKYERLYNELQLETLKKYPLIIDSVQDYAKKQISKINTEDFGYIKKQVLSNPFLLVELLKEKKELQYKQILKEIEKLSFDEAIKLLEDKYKINFFDG